MRRVGFFGVLDTRLAEIHEAHDRADAALDQGNMLGATIGGLQQRVNAQAREIETLRALIGVLARVLRDTGVVDADVLDYRLEAALEEVAEQAAAPAQVTCLRCGKLFPQQQTTLTEMGTMCDRCAAGV
jgi:hypothetical protein